MSRFILILSPNWHIFLSYWLLLKPNLLPFRIKVCCNLPYWKAWGWLLRFLHAGTCGYISNSNKKEVLGILLR